MAPIPRALEDRRVEITGPTDRKMVINALNCGANVFMADFEDANTPHWRNVVGGQVNLADAVRRTLSFCGPDGRSYQLRTDAFHNEIDAAGLGDRELSRLRERRAAAT